MSGIEVAGYHDDKVPVITGINTAILSFTSPNAHPDAVHLITTAALGALLNALIDPAPAGIVDRSVEAIDGVPV